MSIQLEKGQKISLEKPDGGGSLTKVAMGLGWDAATGFLGLGGGSIDLDASAVMLGENKEVLDTVSFSHLRSNDGSVKHSGDNLTGAGDGDDETINVDLQAVPATVKNIVFTINSFQGQTFDKVKNCFARLYEVGTNKEICIFKLSDKGAHTGMIMARVYRHNSEWKMAALGTPCNGRTVADIREQVKQVV